MNKDAPQTLDEAWELLQSRRFLHGHRETLKESFDVVLRDLFDNPKLRQNNR